MRQFLNKVISKWKGTDYTINNSVPLIYLIATMLSRMLMLFRGKISFVQNEGLFFRAKGVTIKCKSKLRLGTCVSLGENVFIDALSLEGVVLGNNVSIGKNCRIEATGNIQQIGKGLKVGNNVGLGADCFYGCAGGIVIGDDTIIGNLVTFHSENHNFQNLKIPIRQQGVSRIGIIVQENCWIGAKVTLLDGAVLESGCIVAAGAVLKEGIYKANGIYGGVPAKLLKFRDE